jgi:hypothetical protein
MAQKTQEGRLMEMALKKLGMHQALPQSSWISG